MPRIQKNAVISAECVACGGCLKSCKLNAISIPKGITALIDNNKCVGCGQCAKACPAGVIEILEREAQAV